MKKHKEGVDFEWRKVEGSNAKSRHFFTKAEKEKRNAKGKAETTAKPKATPKRASPKAAAKDEGKSKALNYGPQNGRGGKRRSSSEGESKPRSKSIAKRLGMDKPQGKSLLRTPDDKNKKPRTKMKASDTSDDAKAARGTGRLSMETRARHPKPVQTTPGVWKRVFNGGRGGMN